MAVAFCGGDPSSRAVDNRQRRRGHDRNKRRTRLAMDQRSFRDMLVFSIGFAVENNRPLLCRILKEHVSDDAPRSQ
jgi:hypothetical protein